VNREQLGGGSGVRAAVVVWALVSVGAGCGGGASNMGRSVGTDAGTPVAVIHPPWIELASPVLAVAGGSAVGGVGDKGGAVHLIARGDVRIDSSASATPQPQAPAVAMDAMTIAADALAVDVSIAGSARVTGSVMAGGSDPLRTITSTGGDLFIDGSLRTADGGGARQALALRAPNGTVYVTGTIDASGAAGAGQSGGGIRIEARRVVITGRLLASGGDSPVTGGAAGNVTIVATESVTVGGHVEAFGGNADGAGAVTGGAAGAVTIQAGGDVDLTATALARGGAATTTTAADAHGGAAGELRIDTAGAVRIGGTFDARGGMASAAGGMVVGGAAGSIHVGEATAAADIAISVPVSAAGGDGDTAGGAGGSVTSEPDTGDLIIAGPGAIDVSGGASRVAAGAGGAVTGGPRHDPGGNSVHIAGDIAAAGGKCKTGGACNGGEGGRVAFELVPTEGNAIVDASGKINVDGGNAAGAGVAGTGGHVWLLTKDGDVTMAGSISARGGDAPDAGGNGGLGGNVYFFSDNNHNGTSVAKGNLLVDTTGVVDASGGKGAAAGGSARSDGIQSFVPVFPDDQENIAIFLNCDGAHGETLNWLENRGHLIARGGASNGNGGDIVYHGIGPGQLGTPLDAGQTQHHPPSGNIDMAGNGAGQAGDFGDE